MAEKGRKKKRQRFVAWQQLDDIRIKKKLQIVVFSSFWSRNYIVRYLSTVVIKRLFINLRSENIVKHECCENLEYTDATPSSHWPNCVRRYETFHKKFNAFFLLFQMEWLWQILWKMRHSAAGTILCKTFLRFPQTRWQRTGSSGFQEKIRKLWTWY